jgi:excisionase family DNA binding protein
MSLEPGSAEESFLTVAEVAELLKLNQQTVRNWIDQGSLPALRVGRRVRIRRSDFDRLLDAGYTGGSKTNSDVPDAPQARPQQQPHQQSQSAEDFWGGEPIGTVEPPNGRGAER